MALVIEIKSASTGEQTISPNAGKGQTFSAFTKVSQTAFVHGLVDQNGAPEPYPVRISVDLGTKERGFRAAYAPGRYEVGEASFFVGKFDDLQLGRLTLIPAVAAVRQAA